MSRPKKDLKKIFRKEILFTEDEFEKLNLLFKDSDYQNMNEMIRDVLLNKQYRVVSFDTESIVKQSILIEQVRRIGSNFNQLIRSFHQKKLDNFSQEERKLLCKNIQEIKEVYIKIEESARNHNSRPVYENTIR